MNELQIGARHPRRHARRAVLRPADRLGADRWSRSASCSLFKGPGSLANVPILMMDELASFALLTIPLFVLLGAAIGASAAGKDIYESLHRWLDRVPGGLVIANILACGDVLGDLRLEPGHRGRHRQGRRAGDDPARRAAGPGHRFDLRGRHPRDPHPAVDHDDPLRHRHRNVDRPAVPGRRRARRPAGRCCSPSTPGCPRVRAQRAAPPVDRIALHAQGEDGRPGARPALPRHRRRDRLRDVRRPGHTVRSRGTLGACWRSCW